MAQDKPQTVTQFAVAQGNLDGDDPQVQAVIEQEKKREKEGRERAQAVAESMAGESTPA